MLREYFTYEKMCQETYSRIPLSTTPQKRRYEARMSATKHRNWIVNDEKPKVNISHYNGGKGKKPEAEVSVKLLLCNYQVLKTRMCRVVFRLLFADVHKLVHGTKVIIQTAENYTYAQK